MGWFDEQIKERVRSDSESFADALSGLAAVITGRRAKPAASSADAIGEILHYFHIKPQELPSDLTDINEQLTYLLRPSGIMWRMVHLTGNWYKDAMGPMLGSTQDGTMVALLPGGLTGYTFYHAANGQRIRVTPHTAGLLEDHAFSFYKPLPLKVITVKDLLVFIARTLAPSDFLMLGLATLAVTLTGLLTPRITRLIYGNILDSGEMSLIWPITILLLTVTLATKLFITTRSILMSRIETKMKIAVESAALMRVLALPVNFFKRFSSGELSARVQSISILCRLLVNTILSTGLTSVFSLIYIAQIFSFAPALLLPALAVLLVTFIFSFLTAVTQMQISRKQLHLAAREEGMAFALIAGVAKIKLSGSEQRAFARWASLYSESAALKYNPPLIVKLNAVISTLIAFAGTITLYYFAVVSRISLADYMAFNMSYGLVAGAFMALSTMALTFANIRPVMEMVEPILNTMPEVSAGKKVITHLTGSLELNNISFRYRESMPYVIENLSLKIRAGQYVAIVGKTGCGKSTLMRLMLGFETPEKGAIYYDGVDMHSLDLQSLRRRMGVVMQDGHLFQGDIYANIVISAPWLTLDQAWEAAEMAGMADDIRAMPMGMHTIITEGGGGISGGQRQRLMIARAIAPRPKILMFDEATSALDNITQGIVARSLDKLKCTRIVIAHRLSTIQSCDRIIVLSNGNIIEDGTYTELIDKNGYFADLVARQRLE